MKPMKGTLTERNVWDIVNFIRTLGAEAGYGEACRQELTFG